MPLPVGPVLRQNLAGAVIGALLSGAGWTIAGLLHGIHDRDESIVRISTLLEGIKADLEELKRLAVLHPEFDQRATYEDHRLDELERRVNGEGR